MTELNWIEASVRNDKDSESELELGMLKKEQVKISSRSS